MQKIVLGLGNPGPEYENTRHNSGRMAAEYFVKKMRGGDFEFNKKANVLLSVVGVGKEKVDVVLPETFMNKSGNSATKLIKPRKEFKNVIVIHDDLDLPLGRFKISYGKSSGGHKGVESIMRALKTKNFVRIRIGVSPKKKPDQKEIIKFIVGKFKPAELEICKKTEKRVSDALEMIFTDSLEKAMSRFNSG